MLIGPVGLRVPGQSVTLPGADARRGAGGGRAPGVAGSSALGAYTGPVAHDHSPARRLRAVVVAVAVAVAVPTLVVWGRQDEVASPAYGRAWADALGDGDLVVVEGAGHLLCRRAAGATFAAVDAFLSAPLTFTA